MGCGRRTFRGFRLPHFIWGDRSDPTRIFDDWFGSACRSVGPDGDFHAPGRLGGCCYSSVAARHPAWRVLPAFLCRRDRSGCCLRGHSSGVDQEKSGRWSASPRRPLPGGGRADDPGCRHGYSALCRSAFQPLCRIRAGGQSGCRTNHRPLDYAVGRSGVSPDAVWP